jgi:hypothetical protein
MAGARFHPLARDIAVVIAVKLVLLAGLWFAFFRGQSPGELAAPAVSASLLDRHTTPSTSRE